MSALLLLGFRKACWNDKKGLCKKCAPDLGVEMDAAQASRSVEEVWAHAKMSEEDKHFTETDWREDWIIKTYPCIVFVLLRCRQC